MLGIMLGVTALITVLSVMNGFEKELRERILAMASHATISGYNSPLTDWRALQDRIHGQAHVVGVAPYIHGEGMVSGNGEVKGVVVRGIDPALEPQVSDVGSKMVNGSLAALLPGEFGVVIGQELARMLGVMPGDKVNLIISKASISPVGVMPRFKRFTVVGMFEAGMYEFDSGLVLLNVDDAAKLFQMGDGVTGLRLKLDDMFKSHTVVRSVAESLGGAYYVSDWTREHANFFRAIQIEKTMMFLILLLIVAVAAFNIVSTLVMVVTDKSADIAILRTLGATPAEVMGIFMVSGAVIGVVGTMLGVIGGVTLALNVDVIVPALESMLGTKFLAPDVYYISELPSDLHWNDVGQIAIVSLFLSLLATIYPAWRASRTQPAEVLRYE